MSQRLAALNSCYPNLCYDLHRNNHSDLSRGVGQISSYTAFCRINAAFHRLRNTAFMRQRRIQSCTRSKLAVPRERIHDYERYEMCRQNEQVPGPPIRAHLHPSVVNFFNPYPSIAAKARSGARTTGALMIERRAGLCFRDVLRPIGSIARENQLPQESVLFRRAGTNLSARHATLVTGDDPSFRGLWLSEVLRASGKNRVRRSKRKPAAFHPKYQQGSRYCARSTPPIAGPKNS